MFARRRLEDGRPASVFLKLYESVLSLGPRFCLATEGVRNKDRYKAGNMNWHHECGV